MFKVNNKNTRTTLMTLDCCQTLMMILRHFLYINFLTNAEAISNTQLEFICTTDLYTEVGLVQDGAVR